MTTLLAWLTSHHMQFVVMPGRHAVRTRYGHHVYASVFAHCTSQHMLTAMAIFHAHTVLYCYHG